MVVGFTHEVMASSYEEPELRKDKKGSHAYGTLGEWVKPGHRDWAAGCISDPAHREPSPRAKLEPLPLAITRSPPCPVNPQ